MHIKKGMSTDKRILHASVFAYASRLKFGRREVGDDVSGYMHISIVRELFEISNN